MSDPARRSSSFSRPTALTSEAPRIEFEHTSSQKASVVCAGVRASGFCSTRRHVDPALGELPRRLAPREPGADHGDESHRAVL